MSANATADNGHGESGIEQSDDYTTGNDEGKLYLRHHNGKEYSVITSRTADGEDTSICLHQLVACLNHDPHEVFADGNVVHHRAATSYPVDVPMNLTVMDAADHARLHVDGDVESAPIDEILHRE